MPKALLIGIDRYPFRKNSIQGASDAIFLAQGLTSLPKSKWTPNNVRLLLNDRATKDEILTRFEWLRDSDLGLLFFSGLGTNISFRSDVGDIDGEVEPCIVPFSTSYDFLPLWNFLSPLKVKGTLVCIFDCLFNFIPNYAKNKNAAMVGGDSALDTLAAKVACPPPDVLFRTLQNQVILPKITKNGAVYCPGGEAATLRPMNLTGTKRSGSLFTESILSSFLNNPGVSYIELYREMSKAKLGSPLTYTPRFLPSSNFDQTKTFLT